MSLALGLISPSQSAFSAAELKGQVRADVHTSTRSANSEGREREPTDIVLSCAKSLVREVEAEVAQNTVIELDKRYARTVMGKIRSKLASTAHQSRSLSDYADRLDNVLRKLKESELALQRTSALKQAPLCICKRRLELRAKHHPEGALTDAFHLAIEAEEGFLVDAREEIAHFIQVTREKMAALEIVKAEVLEDCSEKRRSGHLDHLCLLESSRRFALSPEECAGGPTYIDTTHAEAAMASTSPNSGVRFVEDDGKESTKALILRAGLFLQEGERLCADNYAQIEYLQGENDRVCKQTETAMRRSIATLTAQKKRLERQLEDARQILFAGNICLQRTQRKLRRHDDPLQALNRQFAMRQQRYESQRFGKQNSRDQVQDTLESCLSAMQRSATDFTARVEHISNMIQELKTTEEKLQENLSVKTMMLIGDQACAKVTLKSVAGYFFSPSPRSPREVVVNQFSGDPANIGDGVVASAPTLLLSRDQSAAGLQKP